MKLWLAFFMAWLPATPVFSLTLTVDLVSDFIPGPDFSYSRVELLNTSNPAILVTPIERFIGSDEDVNSSLRIANFFDLTPANYDSVIKLLNSNGDVVFQHQAGYALTVDFGSTIVLTRPSPPSPVTLDKSAQLIVDADEDGQVGTGDTVQYTVLLVGPSGASHFLDTPGIGSRLITGSVQADPHGTVVSGNDPNDVDIDIALEALTIGMSTEITYEVMIEPLIVNQGEVSLLEFNADSLLSATILTDDPGTAVPFDPTVLGVDTGSLQCVLIAIQLQEDLDQLEDDSDNDGIPAIADFCPATATSLAVDRQGCSQAEFCQAIDASTALGEEICDHSDWQNDEPRLGNPKDCKARAAVCAVRT